MALSITRQLFNAPMCDEVAIAEEARKQLRTLSLPPTHEELQSLAGEVSMDLVTRILYEGILASEHGEFVRRINDFPPNVVSSAEGMIKLIVIPGMFYQEHPEMGGDGSLAREIAARFAIEFGVAPINSTGSVTGNSRLLAEFLDNEDHSEIWLLSFSKGASEVRHYLQHNAVNKNIQGWLSVSGTPKGSPLVDRKMDSSVGRAFYYLLCMLTGVEYQGLKEMHTEHAYWKKTNWPNSVEIIHVVPIPLSAHIQGMLRSRYRKLLSHGPNDGFVPSADILDLPGNIYPVWGCDHFMRTPELSGLLYRFFNYIIAQKNA